MASLREHASNISISTIASLFAVLVVAWPVVKPALVKSVSTAVAEDIQELIEDEAEPLQKAFKVLIQADINDKIMSIELLEFREEHQPDTWLEEHARLLSKRRIELAALQEAIAEL